MPKSPSSFLRASVDLGTNTCLLLIAEWDPVKGEVRRVVSDSAQVVRLGRGVDLSRRLEAEAMDRTLRCLSGYSEKVRSQGMVPAQAICVATSQARDASNGAEFFERVARETGFVFRVISGDEEAQMTFRGGLLPGMDPSKSVVIDIGGGSTELMSMNGGKSADLGSVRFHERYLKSDPVTDAEFWACQDEIDRLIDHDFSEWRERWGRAAGLGELALVGVAGTATTLASWHLGLAEFDAAAIDGASLTRGDIHRMVEELKWRTVAERQEQQGIEPGRADVLLAGSLILWRVMERIGFPELRVSTRGLRFGILSETTES